MAETMRYNIPYVTYGLLHTFWFRFILTFRAADFSVPDFTDICLLQFREYKTKLKVILCSLILNI